MASHPARCTSALTLLCLSSCGLGPRRPPPPHVDPPALRPANILIAVADDVSYPHVGASGTAWVRTPAFDRLAREGVSFRRAYTPSAKCSPSRASILTGRNPWQLGDAANHEGTFPAQYVTYVEALAERGYCVGRTGKGWAPGDPGTMNGKRRQLAGPAFDRAVAPPPTAEISPNDYAENFAAFLASCPKGAPWAFWYGGLEPHRGYEYGSGAKKGGKRPGDIDRVPRFLPDDEIVRQDLLDYAFEIEHFDRHLGRMLLHLEQERLLEDTLIVATADNGMPFPRAKGHAYEYSNHVPLAIRWGRGVRQPGRTVADYVSLIDLAPTFLDAAAVPVTATGMAPLTGKSLLPILALAQSTPAPHRDSLLVGKERNDVGRPNDAGYPIRGILRDDLLYLRNYAPERWPGGNPETGYLETDGGPSKSRVLELRRSGSDERFWRAAFGLRDAEELYDLRADPDCLTNLAADPAFSQRKQALAGELARRLVEEADPRALGNGSFFEQQPVANPKNRDHHRRYLSGEVGPASWVEPTDYEPAEAR